MSDLNRYVQHGPDSDVYVYQDGDTFVCHAEGRRYETEDREAMIQHLRMHLRRGQRVPVQVLRTFRDEIDGLSTRGRM